jgi:uncharacterized protein
MNASMKIDTFQFCRSSREIEGRFAIADLSRLADLLSETGGEVQWTLAGRTRARSGAEPDCLLSLRLASLLRCPCSRCLQAVDVTIDTGTEYLVVPTEEEAERRDDPESEVDVLVGARHFDLAEWIEDELILALPPVRFHEHCDGLLRLQTGAPASSEEPGTEPDDPFSDRRRPFEGLSRLKRSDVE